MYGDQTPLVNTQHSIITNRFFLIEQGSGMLVDGSRFSVARRLKLPESMISFTVVALGTSLPKFYLLFCLFGERPMDLDLALGTILGSCIFNFLGVLSITGLSRPIRVTKNTATIGILSLVSAALLLYFMANKTFFPPAPAQLFISKYEAAILILMFFIFMTYGYFNVKKHHVIWFSEGEEPPAYYVLWFSIILMIVGFIGLVAGGVFVVDNLIDISKKMISRKNFSGNFCWHSAALQ